MQPSIDYQAWQFWFNVIQFLGLLALGIYTWWINREKVNAKRFKGLEDDVKERVTKVALEAFEKERERNCQRHRERTGSIEGELKKLGSDISHLPTQADIGRVYDRVHEVARDMDQAVGELKSTRHQLHLVLEELLRRDNS